MRMKFRFLIILLSLFLVMPFSWATSTEIPSARVNLSYEGFLGPLYIMSADVELRLEDGHYRVVTKGKTEGFANWFFHWRNKAVSEGTRQDGGLVPRTFKMNANWNDKDRNTRLEYSDVSPIVKELIPPPSEVENKEVPVTLIDNTVDPLSMALRLMLTMGKGGKCPGIYRVFDGRRRYDLGFTHDVVEDLPGNSSSIFSGSARRCAMAIERIRGFWDKSKLVTDTKGAPEVWFARPAEGVPLLPVKFEATYKFGNIRIYLTRLEQGKTIIKAD